jgi:hypothetical protein
MGISLAGCANWNGPAVAIKANLPPLAPSCAQKVGLPPVIVGEDLRVFSLKNRGAAIRAEARADNCVAFYEDVVRANAPAGEAQE